MRNQSLRNNGDIDGHTTRFYQERQRKLKQAGNVRQGILTRMWDQERRQAILIGNTPSTANDQQDDMTTLKMNKIMRIFGQGGYTLLNVTDDLEDTKKSIEDHAEYRGELNSSPNDMTDSNNSLEVPDDTLPAIPPNFLYQDVPDETLPAIPPNFLYQVKIMEYQHVYLMWGT